eukprot:GHUV01013984.1.p1 GENE.GHUV01013984.1~~GHUV01013984.1.p1  ORF type:complete len:359 (+),score=140.18 GHUV01013984.1:1307-2383(+)
MACRLADASDLPAQVLPKLNQPNALANCWPVLSSEAARSHPRWLEMCILLMDAAARQHGSTLLLSMSMSRAAGLQGYNLGLGLTAETLAELKVHSSPGLLAAAATASELVAAVVQQVRLVARMPQLLEWATDPKWTVASADAALQASGFVLGAQGTALEPPLPDFAAGVTDDEKAAALAAWERSKPDHLSKERRRLAAALFLQQRLPVLVQRRRHILQTREQLLSWAPWLAHLHSLLGGLAAEAASTIAAHCTPAPSAAAAGSEEAGDEEAEPADEAEGEAAAAELVPSPTEASDAASSPTGTATPADKPKPTLTKAGAGAKPSKGGGKGAGKAVEVEVVTPPELMQQISIQVSWEGG